MTPRPRYEMPDSFRDALNTRKLMDPCFARRINKMTILAGLRAQNLKPQSKSGGVNMKIKWKQ